MTPAILVYQFDDAPVEYQKLSTNGGDEDEVIVIPKGVQGNTADDLLPLGISLMTDWGDRVSDDVMTPNGDRVIITCHA